VEVEMNQCQAEGIKVCPLRNHLFKHPATHPFKHP
jgi:hypothetical protein